jgi:hypothetical protein
MKLRPLLLVTLPVLFAPSARADEPQPNLADVRARTDEMQHQVQLAHDRLAAMSKALMTPALAQTTIDVSDETAHAFKLVSARVLVDGALQYDRRDIGAQRLLPVFTGAMSPGEHTVKVEAVVQGNGYGVFSYLRGYNVTLTSTHTWNATTEKPLHVTATVYELNDVSVPFERRPQLRWANSAPEK